MTVKAFTFNPFQQNTYLLYDDSLEAVIVDAGCLTDKEKQTLQQFITDNKLILKRVLNTHLHLDHQFGNRFLFDTYGIKPEASADDEFLLTNVVAQARAYGIPVNEQAQELGAYLKDNELINFGNSQLQTIHVPGHSPGSLVFYSQLDGFIIAGDVLFCGSIGRTDLPGGDYATLIQGITNRLLVLPETTVVYCGHGPKTTIGHEKNHNPYL